MPVKKIQLGQVWKNNETGESFLVTKTYDEALGTLPCSKAGSETEPPVRIKIANSNATANLPGFHLHAGVRRVLAYLYSDSG